MATGDAVARLQELIRVPTVSDRDPDRVDDRPFAQLLEALTALYPRLHTLETTYVGGHGLLVHWPGTSAERPVVLMAHLDVVPAVGTWTHDPFGADVDEDAIWGRGTLDDKGCVAAICEAVEGLLADGVTPAQDVWLSFGCDEEVSGGAAPAAVEELRRRGVRPWFVLDEGGAVAAEAFPGVRPALAVIGVTEKGTTSLRLTATGDGGHASVPRRGGPTARLARAITRLDTLAMPAHLPEPTVELFRRIAPHLPGAARPVVANLGRVSPLAARLLPLAGDEAAAMLRTTLAVTTLEASPAINVIASSASAGVNARVMVGDTVDQVVAAVRRAIRDDTVTVEVLEANEPSPISPRDDAFELIETTVGEIFPEAVPTPYVMMAATDSRFFTAICDRVYRFAPFRMDKAQRASIHAADEHLRVEDFLLGIDWYRRLIERLPR
ncbi:M20/M25/M40 family metallo-hydrolase [Nocardioides sp.]|uniref:M20/M25/M40 family metallo-hydrolase n=1 Tax=Nocardioides sp. TaxID=35761 RepID=UPI002C03622E|nr:M20/M25/M40 family metallo-hydrolase [Nocardioides sp.]HVX53004.1 M20/M25/M40 family metallo-hydrolase [Nocardioides sp.]